MAKLVSQVYAEALFGLGVENGLLDTLLEELNGMCEILGKNPQFVTLLGHPELDQKEKTAVFDLSLIHIYLQNRGSGAGDRRTSGSALLAGPPDDDFE